MSKENANVRFDSPKELQAWLESITFGLKAADAEVVAERLHARGYDETDAFFGEIGRDRLLVEFGFDDALASKFSRKLQRWKEAQQHQGQKIVHHQQEQLRLDPNADPYSLLSTSGAEWPYQQDNEMEARIAERVEEHHNHWVKGRGDKQNHTLFLVCSGVGTGKSRLLTELPGIVKRTAKSEALKRRLQGGHIFNVSFENGTPYDGGYTFQTVEEEIGTRMMFQMVVGSKSWGAFKSKQRNHKSIGDVLEYIATTLKTELQELTIFLMVDGAQKLPHNPLSKATPFYNCISTLAGYVKETSSAFMVCACAATVYLPVDRVLADSPQSREFLLPRQLEGSKIIAHQNDPTLRVLVEDMGGHGRALESLKEVLDRVHLQETELSSYGYSKLANDVRARLVTKYPDWVNKSSVYKEALALCLSGVKVERETKVVDNMTVDSLLSLGLFQLTNHGLQCAYVWIWALSNLARDLHFDDYATIERQNDDMPPLGAQCWQHWEEFNTKFRMLKSSVLEGQTLPVTDFHAGAKFDPSTMKNPPTFYIQRLAVQRASRQYLTTSGSVDEILCEHGRDKVSEARSIFLNGAGAPAGDAFMGLKGSGVLKREVHQYKLLNRKITSEDISKEREKSAGSEDLFLLYSAIASDVSPANLPTPCGLVDGNSFKQYYGPFAGRAFFAAESKPAINKVGRFCLESVEGVGKARADEIMRKRPFDDFEDAVTRTKIPRYTLSRFRFSEDDAE